jgi:hypothetical protein
MSNELKVPITARSDVIAAKVCADQGHSIGKVPPGPDGVIDPKDTLCCRCGFTLAEIRGEE